MNNNSYRLLLLCRCSETNCNAWCIFQPIGGKVASEVFLFISEEPFFIYLKLILKTSQLFISFMLHLFLLSCLEWRMIFLFCLSVLFIISGFSQIILEEPPLRPSLCSNFELIWSQIPVFLVAVCLRRDKVAAVGLCAADQPAELWPLSPSQLGSCCSVLVESGCRATQAYQNIFHLSEPSKINMLHVPFHVRWL